LAKLSWGYRVLSLQQEVDGWIYICVILQVSYVLLLLSRAFGENALHWARESISLIPPQALTDAERSRFLQIISDASLGSSLHTITDRFGEISDVCRRNKTVQDIVQSALRPHDLTFAGVPQQSS
jgi:transportin-3